MNCKTHNIPFQYEEKEIANGSYKTFEVCWECEKEKMSKFVKDLLPRRFGHYEQ